MLRSLPYSPQSVWLSTPGVSEEVIKFYENAFKMAMEDPDYLAAAAEFVTDYQDAAATAVLIEEQQQFTEGLASGFWYE